MRAIGLLVLAAGCGGIETYEVPPREGAWAFEVVESRVDDCHASEVRADAPVRPAVEQVEVGRAPEGFALLVNGGDEGACTQESGWFECRPSIARVKIEEDLVVSTAVFASGWVEDGAFMEGDFTLDLGCRGADCMQFEQAYGIAAPCRVEGSFVAELAQ